MADIKKKLASNRDKERETSILLGGRQPEFQFTEKDFRFIIELIRKHAGINLSTRKRSMVYSRLARRLRELGMESFKEYRCFLEQDNGKELGLFTNALTTNLTRFFREAHHFHHLTETALPAAENRMTQGENSQALRKKRLRVWSAGCSSGEEPYSIAMALSEWLSKRKTASWDAKILATDLDTNMLERCQEGLYRGNTLRDLPLKYRSRYMKKVPHDGIQEDWWQIEPELKSYLTFKKLNLLDSWPMKGPFDVIFCRNVLIYFDKETQTKLAERFASMLHPNGWLYLGHSENLYKLTDRFTLIGRTIYQRIV